MPRPDTPDPLDVALGRAIRRRRLLAGLSQQGLAAACNVSFQQIQKYENGHNRVSFSRLVQIAHALGCRAAEMVDALDELSCSDAVEPHDPAEAPGWPALLTAYAALKAEQQRSLLALAQVMAKG